MTLHESGVNMTVVNDLCNEWRAKCPAPADHIDDLVAHFLCTEGQGHLVSELFPTCKTVVLQQYLSV